MRVANPRQGDFAEPDHGFKGEGPALARVSHRCDAVGQRSCRNPVPDDVAIPARFSRGFSGWRDVEPQRTAARAAGFTHPEYGKLTVDWVLHQLAGHQIHHIGQLQRVA